MINIITTDEISMTVFVAWGIVFLLAIAAAQFEVPTHHFENPNKHGNNKKSERALPRIYNQNTEISRRVQSHHAEIEQW